MARYIDADALLENLKLQYSEELGWQCTVNMSDVGMMIEDAPTADVAPRAEWISVEERLPEPFETVLVFCDTGVRKFQCVSETIESGGKRWLAVCGFKVTHWMPLPEPPKGN